MDKQLIVSPSPHVHECTSVTRLMRDVVIALMPAFLVSAWVYGLNVVVVTATAIASCIVFEYAIQKWMIKGPYTIGNWSAILTGMLLSFNLPSSLPVWMVVLGALVAIGIGKMSFGGLGRNLFNPALVGRVFLLISFPVQMTTFPQPALAEPLVIEAVSGATAASGDAQYAPEGTATVESTGDRYELEPISDTAGIAQTAAAAETTSATRYKPEPVPGTGPATTTAATVQTTEASDNVDASSGATPLAFVKEALKSGKKLSDIAPQLNYKNFLWGFKGGSLGEIAALALLVGFIYLLVRKVITWHTPVFVLGAMALFSGILWQVDPERYIDPLFHLLTGGAILGAVFMATDYVTSPMHPRAMAVYGIGIGVLTILIRVFGAYPEGMSFAILIMNAAVPLINKIKPARFGARTV